MPRAFADLTLADLVAMRPPGSPTHLLGALHRVTRWPRDAEGLAAPGLGRALRSFVAQEIDLALPEIVDAKRSDDGATKLLLRLHDGAQIEAVHMPRAVRNPRVTLCISSQVGCAMGCGFCRTAAMGLVRNLGAGEIVGQVLATLLALGPEDPQRVSLVFMGMGEPLHNLAAVLRAIEILCEPAGLGLSPMRITVSTSGLVAGIDALAQARVRPALALSLNATTDAQRGRLMPIARSNSLESLRAALARFPLRSHEKLTLEYVLLAGDNDADDDADRLAGFAAGLRHNLNVIPWNAFDGASFTRPSAPRTAEFVARLRAQGCLATVRKSRGPDVAGACGQLATASIRMRRGANDLGAR